MALCLSAGEWWAPFPGSIPGYSQSTSIPSKTPAPAPSPPACVGQPPVGGAVIQSTWSTKGTVDYYLANGVPADKILLAIPFYGKRYVGVPGTNNGL